MQGVGKNSKTNLQIINLKEIRECKPKRLSWAAYNDLESKKGKGFAPKPCRCFLELFSGQIWAAPPLLLVKTCIKQQIKLAGKC
jgi:hypothetical protein